MPYNVEISKVARKQIKNLPKKYQILLVKLFETLKLSPRPNRVKKLSGTKNALYRVRLGDYRVIYSIDDSVLVVLIVKVGNRKDIYKNI